MTDGAYRTLKFRCTKDIEPDYDEAGEPVVPGGRWLAEAIAAALAAGAGPTDAVEQHSHYGWDYACAVDGNTFVHVLNAVAPDEVYLTIRLQGFLIKRMLGREPAAALDGHCAAVEAVLATIEGVAPGIEQVKD